MFPSLFIFPKKNSRPNVPPTRQARGREPRLPHSQGLRRPHLRIGTRRQVSVRSPYTTRQMGDDAAVTLFGVLFLGNYKRLEREILTQSAFKSLIRAIHICVRYL